MPQLNIKYPKAKRNKRVLLCPDCGQKSLKPRGGNTAQEREVPYTVCPDCGAPVVPVAPEVTLMTRRFFSPKIAHYVMPALLVIGSVLTVVSMVALAIFWLTLEMAAESDYAVDVIETGGWRWLLWLLIIAGIGLIGFPLFKGVFFRSERTPKRNFSVYNGIDGARPIDPDMRVDLKTSQFKKPRHVLPDYSTYELWFNPGGKFYPVILSETFDRGEVQRYELQFLGTKFGIDKPTLKEGKEFELEDYKGNHISGTITKVYKT